MTHETLDVFAVLGLSDEELEWQHLALCNGQDIWRFHEGYESNPRIAKQTDEMCLSCPVQKQCLQAGIENGEWGCWGGVYLTNGRMDDARNAHKTQDIWQEIREGIA